MSEEALAQLLQSDKLMMDELEVLAAVREWATVNSVRHKFKAQIYQATSFPGFSPTPLTLGTRLYVRDSDGCENVT